MLSKDAAAYDNATLSTIIRCHQRERLPLLEEAIFSLAIQYWHDIELVIVLQNGTDEIAQEVDHIIRLQPWTSTPLYRILSVHIPAGVDGRSSLLNRGIAEATGRFLAFLDDDDVVYQNGYTTLIEQLRSSGHVIAIGGCRAARIQFIANHWFVKTKDIPFGWGRSRLDIFRQNFVPIHSYVIDEEPPWLFRALLR
ncbi:MAG: glycosyltransferase family A protein [Pyrinomonadaceae bacterium]